MATTEKTAKVQPIPEKADPNTEAPVQTSASDPIERDPAEIDKTLKRDAVKVADDTPLEVLDPHYGQGGAYVINSEGIRVKVE